MKDIRGNYKYVFAKDLDNKVIMKVHPIASFKECKVLPWARNFEDSDIDQYPTVPLFGSWNQGNFISCNSKNDLFLT